MIHLYLTDISCKASLWFRNVCDYLIISITHCDGAGFSVRPSITPFWLCSHHRIIMKLSGVITNDQSEVHAKGQGQKSKVKVTKVTTQLNHFRTVSLVWIHIWWWNDAYSLMLLRRGNTSNCKVTRLKKLSNLTQIRSFHTVTPVRVHQWLRNYAHSLR